MAGAGTAVQDGGRADGRLRRGAQTREAIVQAYMELIEAGVRHPRVELIATRAGAGTRTVYNQFRDLEGLRAEVWDRLRGQLDELGLKDVTPEAPLERRVQQLVVARARFYEKLTPFALSAQGLHERSAELRRQRAELIDESRRELSWLFEAELARCARQGRPRLLAALQSATGWPTWTSLRDELELDRDAAAAVITLTLRALLATTQGARPGEPGPTPAA